MKKVIELNFNGVKLVEVGPSEFVSGNTQFRTKDSPDSGWHRHNVGMLEFLEFGLIGLRTDCESIVLSPGMVVYIPAELPHLDERLGPDVRGWYICLPKNRVEFLPEKVCILELSDLSLSLCKRIVSWGQIQEKNSAQKGLVNTLLDELRTAKEERHPRVPLPQQPGLQIVARAIMNQPDDMNTIDYWAKVAGMSRRSFTRYFSEETGLSFVLWRQRVKLHAALKQLLSKRTVTEVAFDLGYQSSGAFISVFRKHFGMPPTGYLKSKNRIR